MKGNFPLLIKFIPPAAGITLTWLGFKLIKNEPKLLIRKLELEGLLNAKSKQPK